jgi:hypothetical protein
LAGWDSIAGWWIGFFWALFDLDVDTYNNSQNNTIAVPKMR